MMLPQAVSAHSVQLDAATRAPSAVTPPSQPAGPTEGGIRGESLAQFAEKAQQTLQSAAEPLRALMDPALHKPLSTGDMLALQAAVSDYSVTLLTLSHLSQGLSSAIQSITQRT